MRLISTSILTLSFVSVTIYFILISRSQNNNYNEKLTLYAFHYDIKVYKIPRYYEQEELYMTQEDKEMLDKINAYAEDVLADIDPQKTRISIQLEKLKPVMEEISKEKNIAIEDVFIKYMDLASEASLKKDADFKEEFRDIANNLQ